MAYGQTSENGFGTPEHRFGRKVREQRQRLDMTQEQLAQRLTELGVNLHPSAIAKIELRDVERPRAIRLDEAVAIAKALAFDIGEVTSPNHELSLLFAHLSDLVEPLQYLTSRADGLAAEVTQLLQTWPDGPARTEISTALDPELFRSIANGIDQWLAQLGEDRSKVNKTHESSLVRIALLMRPDLLTRPDAVSDAS